MTQPSSAPPSFFNVRCPGCGERLRFGVGAEMPPRMRIQCSSCRNTFAVRRPGVEPAQASIAGSLGESPPTYVGFPVSQSPSLAGGDVRTPSLGAVPPRVGDEPSFQTDTVIAGRYRVLRFIARGGMGEVYEVEDQELRERVALKTVRPEAARDVVAIERFRREIQLARKVTHPNVCRIFDVSYHRDATAEGFIFLTMELLSGETLAQRLKRTGPMVAEEALPIARQIAQALDAAHQAGVVHRDLKPGNVMLAENRGALRAVVTDFGLARLAGGGDGSGQGLTLTAAAAVVGPPAYLAPEQVDGSEITA